MSSGKNILNKTRCTIIGSMQYSSTRDVRTYLVNKLAEYGIVVFNHYNNPFVDATNEDESAHVEFKKWLENEEYDKIADQRNRRTYDLKLIDISDFVIFVFDPDIMTCGSFEEFFLANRSKKPIFFVNTKGKKRTPFWIFWTIPHKYIYDSVDDVLKVIADIDSGEHPIDNERWKLLKMAFR